jgi:hypothetical protein
MVNLKDMLEEVVMVVTEDVDATRYALLVLKKKHLNGTCLMMLKT